MTSIATLALVLYIAGGFGLFAQAVGVALGRVSPGWLGLGLIWLAFALTGSPG